MENAVASLSLIGVSRTGEEEAIQVFIGQPYPDGNCWACPLEISLDRHFKNTEGIDTFQALAMAFYMGRFYLSQFLLQGGRLLNEEREDFPLAAYFPEAQA